MKPAPSLLAALAPLARRVGAPLIVAAAVLSSAALAPAALAAGQRTAGEVVETKEAPPYTYLRLKTAEGEVWAAVTALPAKKGDKVVVEGSTMANFESKTLKRTFDRIVFGNVVEANGKPVALADGGAMSGGAGGGMAKGAMPGMGMGMGGGMAAGAANPHGAADAGKAPAPVKVTKATGPDGKTVAEVIGGRTGLDGKSVTVRGQVVKVMHNVMGKTWVHLRDGTGNAADKTHDLVVTTASEQVAIGDVVEAKGKVRANVDLGAGYTYPVLVEDAALRK